MVRALATQQLCTCHLVEITGATGETMNAPEDGYIVFPNPNALTGREWFYFARHSDRRIG